jgi:hypothetical protein
LFGLKLSNPKETLWIVVIFFLALSLTTAGDLLAQAGSTADRSTPEYMDLRRYHLASGPGIKLTNDFFADALIPALNRLGIGPVGAFSVYLGPDSPSYYLLLPSSKLETLVTADLELAKGDVFMKVACPQSSRSGRPCCSRSCS